VRKLTAHAKKAPDFAALEPTADTLWSIIKGNCPGPWWSMESLVNQLESKDTKKFCDFLGEHSERLDRVLRSGIGQAVEARPAVQHAQNSPAPSSAGAHTLAVNARVFDEDTGRQRRAQRGDWYRDRGHDHGGWHDHRDERARADRSRSPWRERSADPGRDRVIAAASGVAVAVVAASRHGTRDEIAVRSHGIKAVLGGPGAKRAVVATSTQSGKIVVNEPIPWTGNQAVAAAPRWGRGQGYGD